MPNSDENLLVLKRVTSLGDMKIRLESPVDDAKKISPKLEWSRTIPLYDFGQCGVEFEYRLPTSRLSEA